ncbi:major head protein [Salicola phage CGphi29]|uniref:major head protein n=1 Tax=Salicola phage CGphi29 TaxID=754067 RepID=UPI0002C06BBE|nr:major head protein [Salicola phage CGphi29]AGH31811.1 hypothetical protein SLPG_00017 [Salicola phage CGphi29]
MANTITNLIPDLYAALDTVSREQTGYIPAVARDSGAERAAVGQNVTYPITPQGNATDVSPSMQVPEPTEQTIGNDQIIIQKSRVAEFGWVGENQRGLNTGPGYMSIQADQIAQAMRTLTNEVETDVAVAAAAGASRAVGTAGTTPFSSDIGGVSQARKTLIDNGAPPMDLGLVINSDAGANLRTLYGINTDRDFSQMPFSQQGVLVTPHGMAIRETGQPVSHTAGDAASATTNSAGYAVGATEITLASAGTGEIKDGDVIQFAGDSNKYVVVSGVADVSSGGTVTIQEPGLQVAIGTSATDITVVSDYDANVAFYRPAIHLVTRAPALPQEGDMAADTMMMSDPRSGLTFEIRVYPGYRKVRYEVGLAWGVKVTQPRHTGLLLG